MELAGIEILGEPDLVCRFGLEKVTPKVDLDLSKTLFCSNNTYYVYHNVSKHPIHSSLQRKKTLLNLDNSIIF